MKPFVLSLSFGPSDTERRRQLADAQRAAAESDRSAREALTLVQQERAARERVDAELATAQQARDESDRALTAAQQDRAAAEQAAAAALALLEEERAAGRAAVADLRKDLTGWQIRCREAEDRDAARRRAVAAALGLPATEIVPGWLAIIDAARFLPRPTRPALTCYVCGADPGTPCTADCRLQADMCVVEDGR